MDLHENLRRAFCANDATALRTILDQNQALRARINDPVGPFDSPAICNVSTRAMLDVLLDAGADINARSRWWAGGFGLLDSAGDELAAYAIERGAIVDAHSAARLGLADRLRELVQSDPTVVHAKGGDGQRPLHFARTVEIARFLLDHGADINARDVDHESTAAQHLIDKRPDVVRFLVERGAEVDIFIAAALGDSALARRLLAANPDCVRLRVNGDSFPMSNPRAGGHIYTWTLGSHLSPHQVALKFGHPEVATLLMEASPPEIRLINACWMGDQKEVEERLAADPRLVEKLSPVELRNLPDAARNNDTAAVHLLLRAGLPMDSRGQHGGTALHWAAWHGNEAMAQTLLERGAPLEMSDHEFKSAPLGWAIHGSENCWDARQSNHAAVVTLLLRSGAAFAGEVSGSPAVRAALTQSRT